MSDTPARDARASARQPRQMAAQDEPAVGQAAAGSLDALRARLAEIGARLPALKRFHQQRGDALAGRLIGTLEREHAQITAKLGR